MHFKPALIFYRGMKQQEAEQNTEITAKNTMSHMWGDESISTQLLQL